MTPDEYGHPTWTPDCSGKWDYDGSIVRVSSRYWPRGGGVFVLVGGRFMDGAEAMPDIAPSAMSAIMVGGSEIARADFKGETEAEVKAQVEAWVAVQIPRVEAAVRAAFAELTP